MKYPHLQRYAGARRRHATGQANGNGMARMAGPSMSHASPPWSGCAPDYSRLAECAPYGPNPGCRVFVLPFDSGDPVPAGAAAQIVTAPQTPFVGKRLVVPSFFADTFTIDDVKVGKDSQFSAAGSINAAVFSEVGVGVALEVDCAYPGLNITLEVTNIGLDAQRFFATFIGNAVEL